MTFDGTIALVTGANRGIGQSLVRALLAHPVRRIYLGARDVATLKPLLAEGGDRVVALKLDITSARDVAAAAAQAPDVNLLVNNAGIIGSQSLLTSDRAALDRDFETNFHGTLAVTRAMLPALERSGRGTIVNLLTLLSYASMPALGGYSAAKAATFSLTQALRSELRARRVSVVGVFPGAVDTDMIRGFEMPKTSPDQVAQAILEGLARGDEDVYPDPMAQQLAARWKTDPKSLEAVFGSM